MKIGQRQIKHSFLSTPISTPQNHWAPASLNALGLRALQQSLLSGGAMGDLIIAGSGLALVLFSVIGASMKTPRRVRNEARSRFPQQKWAEYSVNHTAWILGCWIVITTVVALALFIVPEDQNAIGGVAAAVIAAVLIWVYPGFAPQKHKQRRNKKEEPEQEEAEVPDLTPHKQLDDDTQIFESVVPEKR